MFNLQIKMLKSNLISRIRHKAAFKGGGGEEGFRCT
jgi:hypothetical protein